VDGGINLIDVTDCARGIVAAMEKGQVGEKYILGNKNVSIKEYFDLIVKVAGKGKSPSIRIPSWLAVFSGLGYQMLSRITGKPPVTSASWARVGSHYSWWECTRARKNLALGQRPLEESISDAIKWFEINGYL
jgi:dihydroflavonol-4-reductase